MASRSEARGLLFFQRLRGIECIWSDQNIEFFYDNCLFQQGKSRILACSAKKSWKSEVKEACGDRQARADRPIKSSPTEESFSPIVISCIDPSTSSSFQSRKHDTEPTCCCGFKLLEFTTLLRHPQRWVACPCAISHLQMSQSDRVIRETAASAY